MTLRALDKAYHVRPHGRGESVELMEAMKQAFETVAMAKVSMSRMFRTAILESCSAPAW